MINEPRKRKLHYATRDCVPKSDPKAANLAKVGARQLAEIVRKFESSDEPSCHY